MNKAFVVVSGIIVLAGAGWLGWSYSDFISPGHNTLGTTESNESPDRGTSAPPETRNKPPETNVSLPVADSVPEASQTIPHQITPTPAPRDVELPPETGSAAAQETERTAEAAIAAANARARGEATERAERNAMDIVQAELDKILEPLLRQDQFSPDAIRAALENLPDSNNPLVIRIRERFIARISDIALEARTAQDKIQQDQLNQNNIANTVNRTFSTSTTADSEGDAATQAKLSPFDPAPYIARIKELF